MLPIIEDCVCIMHYYQWPVNTDVSNDTHAGGTLRVRRMIGCICEFESLSVRIDPEVKRSQIRISIRLG